MLDLFLAHYNTDLDIIVDGDASSYGIRIYILHKMTERSHKPVAHAPKTLLPAEKNHSQVEKESLWIIFAVTKFHLYIHGWHFTFQMDHKP